MILWSGQRDTNPSSSAWKADVLTFELCPRRDRAGRTIYRTLQWRSDSDIPTNPLEILERGETLQSLLASRADQVINSARPAVARYRAPRKPSCLRRERSRTNLHRRHSH